MAMRPVQPGSASAGAFSTSNKGIGFVRKAGGCRLRHIDSDPASATYGRILTADTLYASAMPSTTLTALSG